MKAPPSEGPTLVMFLCLCCQCHLLAPWSRLEKCRQTCNIRRLLVIASTAHASLPPELIHRNRFDQTEASALNYIFHSSKKKKETLSLSPITWRKCQFSRSVPIHCNGSIHKNMYSRCGFSIHSCSEDCSQAFSDRARRHLCLDHSPEALSFHPLHSASLSLSTGCCSLHGRNNHQGQVNKGSRGLPGVCVEGWG